MRPITIIQIYPNDMSFDGDRGNTLALKRRLEWRNIPVEIVDHNASDDTDFEKADIIIGGGNQSPDKFLAQKDLLKHAETFKKLAKQNVPFLLVCGAYQLFGRKFTTRDGKTIQCAGVLDLETIERQERLVGNSVVESSDFGKIIGYENHSGQVKFTSKSIRPLGKIIPGSDRSGENDEEGARYKNIIATNLNGPILPKNPQIADFLIQQALKNRGENPDLSDLPIDKIAKQVHLESLSRSR